VGKNVVVAKMGVVFDLMMVLWRKVVVIEGRETDKGSREGWMLN